MTDGKANAHKLTELTVDIVSAYVSNNLCPDTMAAKVSRSLSKCREPRGRSGCSPSIARPSRRHVDPPLPIHRWASGPGCVAEGAPSSLRLPLTER